MYTAFPDKICLQKYNHPAGQCVKKLTCLLTYQLETAGKLASNSVLPQMHVLVYLPNYICKSQSHIICVTTVTYFKQRFPVSSGQSGGREVEGSKLFYGIDEAWLVGNGEDGGQGGGVDGQDEDGEDPPTTQNKTS